MNNTKTQLVTILLDIRYSKSMNEFEEYFGEGVSYSKLEQETYVDLKKFIQTKLGKKIKFRKHERSSEDMVLTIRAEIEEVDFEQICNMKEEAKTYFMYDFVVVNIRKFQE